MMRAAGYGTAPPVTTGKESFANCHAKLLIFAEMFESESERLVPMFIVKFSGVKSNEEN